MHAAAGFTVDMTASTSLPEPDGGGPAPRLVLVTGAAGRIGRGFAASAQTRYTLRLTDRPEADSSGLAAFGEFRPARLDRPEELAPLFEGVDTVVHLAAQSSPSTPWERLLPDNIVATYHVFAAAEAAGCRRVVFASSIHAVSGYPRERMVEPTDPVNPGDLYGGSKCSREALGRYAAEQRGLSVVALRIGAFQPLSAAAGPDAEGMSDMYIAPTDLYRLLCHAIDLDGLRFAIVHAVGDNDRQRLDVARTRELLGYAPEYGWAAAAGGAVRRRNAGAG